MPGKRPVARPRSRQKDNIKMDLIETGSEDVKWTELRTEFEDKIMNFRNP
jgi:hypothetical protein